MGASCATGKLSSVTPVAACEPDTFDCDRYYDDYGGGHATGCNQCARESGPDKPVFGRGCVGRASDRDCPGDLATTMKRVIDISKWASATSHQDLALFFAMGLLLLLLCLLVDSPSLAQEARTVHQASIAVNQTVGTAVGICSPTAMIAAPTNTNVHYCVSIRNTGSVPLSHHTISTSLADGSATFEQTIAPGEDPFSITSSMIGSLLSQSIPASLTGTTITHTVMITSTNAQGDVATGQAEARVIVGSTGLRITKTVGLATSGCTDTRAIAVAINTPVTYCVTMQNTGTLTLTRHQLIDPLLSVNETFDSNTDANLIISPGETIRIANVVANNAFLVTDNITNTVTVNSSTAEGVSVSAQAQAAVLVGRASIAVTSTWGLVATTCGTNTAMAIVSGRTIYHCLRLTNEGTIPLETHEIRSATAPIVSTTITETLQPGQSLVITSTRIPQLVQANMTISTTSNFAVTSRNSLGIVATDSAQSQIRIGTQTITLAKYATTDPNGCVTTSPLNIVSNQSFYYCLIVTNTGSVPLVRYTFSEGSPLNISGTFDYPLAPTQRMTLTNQFLTNNQSTARLGPFTASASFPGSLTFTAFSADNVSFAQTASFQINISAPVATTTPSSTPFPTFTPTISPTPTPTPIIPPTPTTTPIVMSLPATPSQPFDINAVTTPTPGVDAGSAPPALDAFGQPIVTPDPALPVDMQSPFFTQTAEAAATQTAWAFVPPPVVDTPTPPPTTALFVASPLESPLASPTQLDETPTATPLALVHPLATPMFFDSYLDVIAHALQVSTATLGWIWFLVGSVIFFATGGLLLGLSWLRRRQQQGVYDVNAGADLPADYDVSTPGAAQPANPTPPNDEDFWPASLR